MQTHGIVFKPRPTRKHNKTGAVERKIQSVKGIIRKLDGEISGASASEWLLVPCFCQISSRDLGRSVRSNRCGDISHPSSACRRYLFLRTCSMHTSSSVPNEHYKSYWLERHSSRSPKLIQTQRRYLGVVLVCNGKQKGRMGHRQRHQDTPILSGSSPLA